jgi:hypothetical protein
MYEPLFRETRYSSDGRRCADADFSAYEGIYALTGAKDEGEAHVSCAKAAQSSDKG